MAREQNYGGAPQIGHIKDDGGTPSSPTSSGAQDMYGGAPSVKDRLTKGEKQVSRDAGETYPEGFGGAPTFKKNPTPSKRSGNAGNASSNPSGTVP